MKNAWAQITLTGEDLVLTPRACEELAPTSRTCEELVPTNKHLVLSSVTGVRLYFFFRKLYPIYLRGLETICRFYTHSMDLITLMLQFLFCSH